MLEQPLKMVGLCFVSWECSSCDLNAKMSLGREAHVRLLLLLPGTVISKDCGTAAWAKVQACIVY